MHCLSVCVACCVGHRQTQYPHLSPHHPQPACVQSCSSIAIVCVLCKSFDCLQYVFWGGCSLLGSMFVIYVCLHKTTSFGDRITITFRSHNLLSHSLLCVCVCARVQVVGMGVAWNGGDIVRYPGGGHKINLLKPVVEKLKDEKNLVVMFVDRYSILSQAQFTI